jgi:RNA polymerase sigma-70 factor (ECF subfamily)
MAPTDNELVQKAQRGDMSAFEQLVFRHDRQVLSIAARYVTSSEDAKDIYQEVFIRAYKGLKKFHRQSEFATWLHRITTNVCLTHRTRRKKNIHVLLNDGYGEDNSETNPLQQARTNDASPDQQTIASEISAHVQDALESLPPKQKLVFTLKHYQGYKLNEIASMMNCTVGTVKRYLFMATRNMRQQLKKVYD